MNEVLFINLIDNNGKGSPQARMIGNLQQFPENHVTVISPFNHLTTKSASSTQYKAIVPGLKLALSNINTRYQGDDSIKVQIFVEGHGYTLAGKHYISIDPNESNPTSVEGFATEQLFRIISTHLPKVPVEILILSCFGGLAQQDVNFLSPESTLYTYSSATTALLSWPLRSAFSNYPIGALSEETMAQLILQAHQNPTNNFDRILSIMEPEQIAIGISGSGTKIYQNTHIINDPSHTALCASGAPTLANLLYSRLPDCSHAFKSKTLATASPANMQLVVNPVEYKVDPIVTKPCKLSDILITPKEGEMFWSMAALNIIDIAKTFGDQNAQVSQIRSSCVSDHFGTIHLVFAYIDESGENGLYYDLPITEIDALSILSGRARVSSSFLSDYIIRLKEELKIVHDWLTQHDDITPECKTNIDRFVDVTSKQIIFPPMSGDYPAHDIIEYGAALATKTATNHMAQPERQGAELWAQLIKLYQLKALHILDMVENVDHIYDPDGQELRVEAIGDNSGEVDHSPSC